MVFHVSIARLLATSTPIFDEYSRVIPQQKMRRFQQEKGNLRQNFFQQTGQSEPHEAGNLRFGLIFFQIETVASLR